MTTIQQTIDDFLSSLNTESTRRAYGVALRHFSTFLTEQGAEVEQEAGALSVGPAIEFVAWLRRRDPAPATIKLYLTAIQCFYDYLIDFGAPISTADAARMKRRYKAARDIRGEKRPRDYSIEAVGAVIQAARSVEPQGLVKRRDVAIVESLRATGCRVGELVGLNLGDLDCPAQAALVYGKGGKYRRVYWDAWGWTALRAYLDQRQEEDPQSPVFSSHGNRSGGALTTRHVSRVIRTLAERAGVPDVTAHYFRHVFATRALAKTGNLALVQDLLGHASPVTTRVYARTDEAQRQAGHKEVWG